MLLFVTIFMAVVLTILALYSLIEDLSGPRTVGLRQWVEKEMDKRHRERARKSLLLLKHEALPETAAKPSAPSARPGTSLYRRLEIVIEQAGIYFTPWQLLATAVGLAVVAGVAGAFLSREVAVAATLVGLVAPFVWVLRRRRARKEQMMGQLPRAFDLMVRVIRAGLSVPQALQAVVEEFEPPLATEFAYCQEQQKLGLDPEISFRELSQRSDLMELKIFVMAMLVQQKTGGNLSELLDRLVRLIRDRVRVQGVVRTVTAESRLQAMVLIALPPLMFLILTILHPHYAEVLIEHYELLIAATISMALGALWIRWLVRFDF